MTISSVAVANAARTANALKHLSDAELVSAARESGSTAGAAFGELVRRYQRMVYALAASLVRPSDAEDVVQETFLRAFRNLDLLADPGRFGMPLPAGRFASHAVPRRSRASRPCRALRRLAFAPFGRSAVPRYSSYSSDPCTQMNDCASIMSCGFRS